MCGASNGTSHREPVSRCSVLVSIELCQLLSTTAQSVIVSAIQLAATVDVQPGNVESLSRTRMRNYTLADEVPVCATAATTATAV